MINGRMESGMKLSIDLKNYNTNGTIFKRTASRGIIKVGDKYLIIHSKYCDYKFPGGGVKSGESLEETLIREVQEETGCIVIPSTIKPYGIVEERRKGTNEEIIEMTSHYYLCEIEHVLGTRNLDQYEQEYDYQVIWLPLEKAIEFNRTCGDFNAVPWVKRDTMVMEYLLKQNDTIL